MWCIHGMEYYSAMKKNDVMLFAATWMELEIIILSEVRRGSHLYDVTYMWSLKYDATELIYKTDSQIQKTNLWLPRGRLEVSRCKLQYIEWINKVPLYSTVIQFYTHTHTHCVYTFFFILFSIMVYHRILNIILCALQQDLIYPFYI